MSTPKYQFKSLMHARAVRERLSRRMEGYIAECRIERMCCASQGWRADLKDVWDHGPCELLDFPFNEFASAIQYIADAERAAVQHA